MVLLHGVELYLSIDPPEIALRQTVDVVTNCMPLNSLRTAYYALSVKIENLDLFHPQQPSRSPEDYCREGK
jgi:hypothetical protein